MNKLYVIGVGGVGSWLVPALINLTSREQLMLIDGDELEPKNLDRQLFSESDVGKNKAHALAGKYQCDSTEGWFAQGIFNFAMDDWLVVCVDNHAARKDALMECDRCECNALIAANETWSADCYIYKPEWRKTKLDPRVYFPEILTDATGDPRARAVGCTGEIQQQTRQLVSANMMAASLAANMYALWTLHVPKLHKRDIKAIPYRRLVTRSGSETFLVGDIERTDK
jgi:molybdopterin/thiamine biosynthesis adenylyltransferase